MELIIFLIALGAERFLHVGDHIHRFNWFGAYVRLLHRVTGGGGLWSGFPGLIILALPILIAVAIVYYLLAWMFFGFVGDLLSVAIVIYCLGPKDIYTQLENYFVAKVQGNSDRIQQTLSVMVAGAPKENEAAQSRALTRTILQQFNPRIFAVLFWFMIIGPIGAVLYRVIEQIRQKALEADSIMGTMEPAARWLQDILDWIPVRLMGFGYALVGDFRHSFGYWLKNVGSGLAENLNFAVEAGLTALHLSGDNGRQANVNENKSALKLTDHALILFLVVIALFVIGGWIY